MTTVQLFAFNNSIAKELKERITPEAIANPFVKNGKTWAPSSYQQRIFDWIKTGRGSAIGKAVAGSGKSTTVVAGLSFMTGVQAKDVRASTFHSVGFGAIMKRLGKTPQQILTDGSKVRKLARQTLGEVEYDMYADFCCRLVGLAKGEGIGPLTADLPAAWFALISHHDLYLDDEGATEERAIEIARQLLQVSNQRALDATLPMIDFDDMLYLPLLWKCRLWQNDWVIVDEAQDTNPVRRAIAKLALKPGGRLLAVGDDKQAIYGFTGASHDAMDLIRKEFNCIELPLTVSYRCPKSVAEKVHPLVPYFEVPEGAIQGVVKGATLEEALKELDAHDAILCRQTSPLIETAFMLISRGVGCVVLGKEIGAGLISLIKKMKANGVDRLVAKLEEYREREVAKFMAKGEEGKAESVSDRVACIRTVIDNLPETGRTIPALIQRLDGMFSDTNGVLTLATVHKVKGKEYRRVAILQPELMPSKWARQEHQYQQELNLQYVAWTRATETLIELTTAKVAKKEEK